MSRTEILVGGVGGQGVIMFWHFAWYGSHPIRR